MLAKRTKLQTVKYQSSAFLQHQVDFTNIKPILQISGPFYKYQAHFTIKRSRSCQLGHNLYNTICLWKHHVSLLLQGFRSVSPDLYQC